MGTEMILFLDFDGVLHPIPTKDRNLLCHVPRLEGVLRDFPYIQVVVSSLWRASHDLEGLRHYFSEDIRPRIIGMTPFTETPAYMSDSDFILGVVRYKEILLWIEQNKYEGPWLALDDAWREFPDPCEQLIRCETEIGFDSHVESMLVQRLALYELATDWNYE
ncbi:MAG: HAD domain-containing protein [Pseudomonadota bacterium]